MSSSKLKKEEDRTKKVLEWRNEIQASKRGVKEKKKQVDRNLQQLNINVTFHKKIKTLLTSKKLLTVLGKAMRKEFLKGREE